MAKKEKKKISTSAKFDPDEYARLKAVAALQNMTIEEALNDAIKTYTTIKLKKYQAK